MVTEGLAAPDLFFIQLTRVRDYEARLHALRVEKT
jgi:hypothetical protein